MKKFPAAMAHTKLSQTFENIWFLKGAVKMPMAVPVKFSRSMVVLRHGEELSIINSIRMNEGGLAELDELGKLAHIVRIGGFHGRDDAFYKSRYPDAKLHCVSGQKYVRDMEMKGEEYLHADHYLTDSSDLPFPGELIVIRSSNPVEGIIRLADHGGILITADSLQNTPKPDRFVNFPAKMMMKKMGFFKPHNVGPGWLQFAAPSESEVRAIGDIDFEHVLPGHGDAVIGDAKRKYSDALNGPLVGCHDH